MEEAVPNSLVAEPLFTFLKEFSTDAQFAKFLSYVHLIKVATSVVFPEPKNGIFREDVGPCKAGDLAVMLDDKKAHLI